MIINKINISEKLRLINEYWKPGIIGELNNQQIKLVKIKGEFVLHSHENEDELFLVIQGTLKMEYDGKLVLINEGEFIIIPRGVKHRPMADEEVHLLLFEPATTINTGNVRNEMTIEPPTTT